MTETACSKSIRVMLVDDHRTVLWGLEKLVDSARPRMEVVGTAIGRLAALETATATQPEIVLLDLDLGADSGVTLIPELSRVCAARIIVLTGSRDADTREQVVLAGARGIVHKSESADIIIRAIEQVQAGEFWLDRGTVARVFAAFSSGERRPSTPHAGLTSAELKVIVEVVRHKSAPNKVIANALNISSHTLRNHLASIYDKLNIHRRLDLVLYALDKRIDHTAV
jgi:DNA-binding NarL/FixJ family response regulator